MRRVSSPLSKRLWYLRWITGLALTGFQAEVIIERNDNHVNQIEDDPAPQRFAQGMAGSFLLLTSLALLVLVAAAVGWAWSGLVSVLVAINLLFSFCTGCFTYCPLTRFGLIRPHRIGPIGASPWIGCSFHSWR